MPPAKNYSSKESEHQNIFRGLPCAKILLVYQTDVSVMGFSHDKKHFFSLSIFGCKSFEVYVEFKPGGWASAYAL